MTCDILDTQHFYFKVNITFIMSVQCKKFTTCISKVNNHILVVDTCVVENIIVSIMEMYKDKGLVMEEIFERMFSIFSDYLEKMSLCPLNNRLITSKRVFNKEMNPINESSALYKKDIINEVCLSKSNGFQIMRGVLNSNIFYSNYGISESEIKELRNIIKNMKGFYGYPSNNDLSLILLCLKLGKKYGSFLLTDDSTLIESIDLLKQVPRIKINDNIYLTNKIIDLSTLSYLSDIYICCELYHEQFWTLYNFIDDFNKSIKNNSLFIYMTKQKSMNQVIAYMSKHPKEKTTHKRRMI